MFMALTYEKTNAMNAKIIYLFILSIFSFQIKAQSALTAYALPPGNNFDRAYKGDMKIDASGNIWIAYSGRMFSGGIANVSSIGLAKFDGTSWITYNTTNSVMPTNYLTSLEFNGNDLWIGTKNGLVKKNNSNWTIYNKSNSGIISDSVNDVKVKNGIVWIATDNGISKFDGTNWTNYNKSNSSLITDMVTSIDADNNGNVWSGTSVGLSKLNNGIITNYTSTNSGLKNDYVENVFVDTKGNVWIAGTPKWDPLYNCSGIYKIVNGIITPLENIIDHCSQSNLPSTYYTATKTFFSSDTKGNVFIQGSQTLTSSNPIPFASILEISTQNIISYDLRQYDLLYAKYGVIIQVDNSGNLWMIANYGFQLKIGNNTSDSLFKFTPANYVKKPVDAFWNGFDKIEYLNINKVSTPILTRGDMFWDLTIGAGYEVPKGSCKKPLFASAMWVGGIVNGNLKIAAQTYRQNGNDYQQGPLTIGKASTDSVTTAAYTKIWKLNRWQIDNFKVNYTNPNYQIPNDILTWPAHGDTTKGQAWNLAPFVNVGGLPNKYEPLLGDYPLIKGDQMLYWIFNDQVSHTETYGSPLGIEVHGSAYAFKCDDVNDNDSNTAINYTTFYHYDIYNRTDSLIDSLKVGMWTDVDLGNYSDDYIGCNPKLGYGYVYNGLPIDSGFMGYGANPPALAVVQLKGTITPSGNNQGLHNFVYYNNDWTTQGNMQRPGDYWGYLNSRWKNGSPIKYGLDGTQGSDTSSFMFPGNDDLAGRPNWSETSVGNKPGDRRFLMASGPVSFPSGAMQSVDYAIVFTRTSSAAIPVLPALENDVKRVKNWFNTNSFPSCASMNGINETRNYNSMQRLSVYPNPASNLLSVQYTSKTKNVNYEVFDLTGRTVLKGNINESNTISIQSLNSGLFIIKVIDGNEVLLTKFLKEN